MNTATAFPFTLPDTAPALAHRLALILAGLAAVVARRFVRMPHLACYTLLLWARLNRAVRRFARALTRPAKPRPRCAPASRADDPQPRPLALPRGRGWIVRELGWEAAAFMAQLEALLSEIATQKALAQAPRAARILRPICRMLGVSPTLTPTAAPRPPAPAPTQAQTMALDAPPVPPGWPGFVGDGAAFARTG